MKFRHGSSDPHGKISVTSVEFARCTWRVDEVGVSFEGIFAKSFGVSFVKDSGGRGETGLIEDLDAVLGDNLVFEIDANSTLTMVVGFTGAKMLLRLL